MRRSGIRMLGVLLVALAFPSPTVVWASPAPAPLAPAPIATTPAIEWRACGAAFECGTLAVPLDDGAPDGAALDLAVVRRQARDHDRRIGSLVFNPGGPGASGIAYLRSIAETLPAELQDRFDLVSFDPRGVGQSAPVECVGDVDPLFDQSFSPDTPGERGRLVAAFRVLVDGCARGSALLAHVSTLDTARDLDRLRQALGEERLNFVGLSYGTFLGTVYASQFPDHVRAFVFDGAVDPVADAESVTLAQARGFERALDAFFADCARHRGCAFHHNGRPAAAYDALRARAARAPLPTAARHGRTLNATRFDAAVLQVLYAGRAGWRGLAQALADAEQGNAATLLGLADSFVGRESDGARHHALDAFWATTCLDGPLVGDVDSAARLEARARELAPRLGAFLVNFSLACSVWPVPPAEPTGALDAAGAPPILVVGTTGDPATPLAGARSLVRTLDRATLLIAKGEQHTAFALGNACVDRAVTRYLVRRALPKPTTRC